LIGESLPRFYTQFSCSILIDDVDLSGEPSWTLPMPGRFVIDRTGIVRAVDVGPDDTYRPEPQKTLDDLAALG
jgi:hypothetical protein